MKISFACPSCLADGTSDASAAGKAVRCKQCGYRFTIPGPDPDAGWAEPDAVQSRRTDGQVEEKRRPEKPAVETRRTAKAPEESGYAVVDAAQENVFTPRIDEPPVVMPVRRKRKKKRSASEEWSRTAKEVLAPAIAWLPRLVGSAVVFALVVGGIALFAPNGVVLAARVLMGVGCVMILLGFVVGAYGACREDFIYGFLYLVIPCYCAYYFLTRWDDLWVWFLCMTAGAGMASLGVEMTTWGAVAP